MPPGASTECACRLRAVTLVAVFELHRCAWTARNAGRRTDTGERRRRNVDKTRHLALSSSAP